MKNLDFLKRKIRYEERDSHVNENIKLFISWEKKDGDDTTKVYSVSPIIENPRDCTDRLSTLPHIHRYMRVYELFRVYEEACEIVSKDPMFKHHLVKNEDGEDDIFRVYKEIAVGYMNKEFHARKLVSDTFPWGCCSSEGISKFLSNMILQRRVEKESLAWQVKTKASLPEVVRRRQDIVGEVFVMDARFIDEYGADLYILLRAAVGCGFSLEDDDLSDFETALSIFHQHLSLLPYTNPDDAGYREPAAKYFEELLNKALAEAALGEFKCQA